MHRKTASTNELYYTVRVQIPYSQNFFNVGMTECKMCFRWETHQHSVHLHLDLQGSLIAISNTAGNVVEERNYDAWGRPRIAQNQEYQLSNPFGGSSSTYTLRGYTFHEHLDMFDLINMNGRMYDTHLGQFINADPILQDDENSQNINRYSYVLNNPMKYTDPSGYAYGGFSSSNASGAVMGTTSFMSEQVQRFNHMIDAGHDVFQENFFLGFG